MRLHRLLACLLWLITVAVWRGCVINSCFIAGTPILTPSGAVPIEAIRIGQQVYSYDTELGQLALGTVTQVFVHPDVPYETLPMPEGGSLGITGGHPVYAAGRYVEASTLGPADQVLSLALGTRGPLVRPQPLAAGTRAAGRATVYNLAVAPHHNYFAGGILVHNKDPPPERESDELTVRKLGSGSGIVTSASGIACGTNCSLTGSTGTTVVLSATADPGSRFAGWSDACTGAQPTCTVTLHGPATLVTATFGGGKQWNQEYPVPAPMGASFTGVGGWPLGEVFVASALRLLRWDGVALSVIGPEMKAPLRRIWGRWAVGDQGTLLSLNGGTMKSWVSGTTKALTDVWGTGNEAWAVGQAGTLVHFDGLLWRAFLTGISEDLHAIWGSSNSDLWIGGAGGGLWRFDGSAYTKVPTQTTEALRGIWGSGPNDVWLVGDRGVVRRWDGVQMTRPALGGSDSFTSIWGSGPGDVWFATQAGALLRWDGTRATKFQLASAPLRHVSGSGANDVWTVGDGRTALRWDGSAWAPGTGATLRAVSGGWAVGDRGVILRQQAGWAPVASGTSADLRSIWGSRDTDLWAVGAKGTLLHWDGSRWAPVASGTSADLEGIWGSGDTDLWAVGAKGTLLHWDGSRWTAVASRTSADLEHVWGSSTQDVWVVGAQGTILRGGGGRFGPVQQGGPSLHGVAGSGPDDVWVVGAQGTILRWKGSEFTRVDAETSRDLYTVWAGAADEVVIAGAEGTVLYWNGSALGSYQISSGDLHGLWGDGQGSLRVVGADASVFASDW